jgi:hypothetical protein
MQWKAIVKKRDHRVWFALAGVAVLVGASAVAKVVTLHVEGKRVRDITALSCNGCEPNELQEHLEEAQETADALKQGNLFVKPPPKTHPVKQVEGILGNEALISGKWYKVGAKVGDAKILEIGPTEVRIEWDGKTTAFTPMAVASSGPSRPARPEPAKRGGPSPPRPAPRAEVVKTEAPEAPAADDPLAWLGVSLSPQLKEKLLERWNKLSDEEKEERKREWNEMDDEQKQQTLESLERM